MEFIDEKLKSESERFKYSESMLRDVGIDLRSSDVIESISKHYDDVFYLINNTDKRGVELYIICFALALGVLDHENHRSDSVSELVDELQSGNSCAIDILQSIATRGINVDASCYCGDVKHIGYINDDGVFFSQYRTYKNGGTGGSVNPEIIGVAHHQSELHLMSAREKLSFIIESFGIDEARFYLENKPSAT